MLTQTKLFGLLGGLLVLAFFANRLSRRSRVPDLVILMATGLIVGPFSGWIEAGQFQTFTHYLGTFALILILFEAGTELNMRESLRHFPAGVLLAFLGYGLSFAAVACIALQFLNLPIRQALLLGGVFGCTSSTIVIPVLQQFEIRGPATVVLMLEAALGDAIAVLTVGSLVDIAGGDPLVAGLVGGFLVHTAVSIMLAIATGVVWSRLGSRFTGHRFGKVLDVGNILVLYALVRIAGGSGLLAVLAFGLTLANVRGNPGDPQREPGIMVFHSELSFLVRSFFFVLLGASVEFVARPYAAATVLIVAGLIVARAISVFATTWALRDVSRHERGLMLCLFPRGLVNAVLAVQVAGKGGAMEFVPAMAFTVILITNLLLVLGVFRFPLDAASTKQR